MFNIKRQEFGTKPSAATIVATGYATKAAAVAAARQAQAADSFVYYLAIPAR